MAPGSKAAAAQPGFFGRHDNIYLYIPNLIGARKAGWSARVPRQPQELLRRLPSRPACPPQPTAAAPTAGYARVAFALYAFAIALRDPTQCFLAYFFRWVQGWRAAGWAAGALRLGAAAGRWRQMGAAAAECAWPPPRCVLQAGNQGPRGSSNEGAERVPSRSFVCDELDGRFARKFGQTSTLGAVLDMVTDR